MNRFIVGFSHIRLNTSGNYTAIPIAEKQRIGNLDGVFGIGINLDRHQDTPFILSFLLIHLLNFQQKKKINAHLKTDLFLS